MSEHRFRLRRLWAREDPCGFAHYGLRYRQAGAKVCYSCCGKRDSADMSATGRAVLYLTEEGPEGAVVSNWPGTLKFRVRHKRVGSHNLAGRRVDVWFTDSDGREWHGINYGHNSQLCHCRRLRMQHDTGYRADSLRSLVGLPDVPGFRPIAGLVTRGALPGFRLAAGLPRRAGQRRASLPIAAGLVKIGLPPGLPPGWSLGKRCRASGLPPGFHVGAGQRRASLPIAAGPCAGQDRPGRSLGNVAGLPDVPTCAGQRRASGRHSGSARKRARGCLARANRKLLARLRPSLPCGAWGIDSQEEGT